MRWAASPRPMDELTRSGQPVVALATTKTADPRAGFLASLVYTDTQLLVARSLFVGNIWLADLAP